MKTIQIFDPALCCSSGVCGPETDPALVAFAADFEWARTQGVNIERFNLAQQPLLFAQNEIVKGFLARSGKEALPLILVDGEVALAGRYPRRGTGALDGAYRLFEFYASDFLLLRRR